MDSTLFLSEITCLDHAMVVPAGPRDEYPSKIKGGSYMVSCFVSGKVDEYENVVVDFSNIKKFLKSELDDYRRGYDHKLLLIPGTPDVSVGLPAYEGNVLLAMHGISVELPAARVTEFRHVTYSTFSAFQDVRHALQYELSAYLTERATLQYEQDIEVKVVLTGNSSFTTAFQGITNVDIPFNYIHGLPHSSSVGCRNIAHGHESFVSLALNADAFTLTSMREVCQYIRQELLGPYTVFAAKNNARFQDGWVSIQYGAEGAASDKQFFRMIVNPDVYTVNILERDTTVENITAWLNDKLVSKFGSIFARLAVSEGLTKGAVIYRGK